MYFSTLMSFEYFIILFYNVKIFISKCTKVLILVPISVLFTAFSFNLNKM